MLKGRRILLTGGRGFIGSHLALRLCLDNEVIVADNRRRDALRFQTVPAGARLTVYDRDVLQPGALDDLLPGVDTVVHLAAVAGVSNYVRQPATTLVNNLVGTYRVLQAVHRQPLVRFVNFSSSEVYGPEALAAEEGSPTVQGPIGEARWSYAVSKTASEHLCFAYHKEHGLPVVSVRPFNIYGPCQVGEGAVHDIALSALRGQTVVVTGDGEQVRTWCYIDDMVEAALCIMEQPEAVGQVFNVGCAAPVVRMMDLARRIIELAGSRSAIELRPHVEVDVRLRSPCVDKLQKRIGFEPQVSLEQGLIRTIAWYRDHLDMLETGQAGPGP